jgi:hypothetical protein
MRLEEIRYGDIYRINDFIPDCITIFKNMGDDPFLMETLDIGDEFMILKMEFNTYRYTGLYAQIIGIGNEKFGWILIGSMCISMKFLGWEKVNSLL